MLPQNKNAVIYGAGGAIGGAVARAFAREGARLFLTGRRRAPVEAVAKDIVSAGGSAEAAEVDALCDDGTSSRACTAEGSAVSRWACKPDLRNRLTEQVGCRPMLLLVQRQGPASEK